MCMYLYMCIYITDYEFLKNMKMLDIHFRFMCRKNEHQFIPS